MRSAPDATIDNRDMSRTPCEGKLKTTPLRRGGAPIASQVTACWVAVRDLIQDSKLVSDRLEPISKAGNERCMASCLLASRPRPVLEIIAFRPSLASLTLRL